MSHMNSILYEYVISLNMSHMSNIFYEYVIYLNMSHMSSIHYEYCNGIRKSTCEELFSFSTLPNTYRSNTSSYKNYYIVPVR